MAVYSRPSNVLRIAVRKYEPFIRAIRKQFALFRAATQCPFELDVAVLDLSDLRAALLTTNQQEDWDIFFVVSDWMAEAAEQGALLDLSPFLKTDPPSGYPEGWSSSLLGSQQVDGKTYGLPYHDGPECLIFRKDLFESPAERAGFARRFGRELRVPETWEEYHDVARYFHRPTQNLNGTVFAGFPDAHNTVYDFCIQLWSRGGELVDRSGEIHLDSDAAHAGLAYYRSIANDPSACASHAVRIDSIESGRLFRNGQAAMMANWFGFAAECQSLPGPVQGKIGIAPLPSAAGVSPLSLNVYWMLGLSSRSLHAGEAYRFLRYLGEPSMDRMTSLEGGVGCRRSTWFDPELNHQVPFYSQLEKLHGMARTLPHTSSYPQLAKIIDSLMVLALTGTDSTEALLQRAQEQVENLSWRQANGVTGK